MVNNPMTNLFAFKKIVHCAHDSHQRLHSDLTFCIAFKLFLKYFGLFNCSSNSLKAS